MSSKFWCYTWFLRVIDLGKKITPYGWFVAQSWLARVSHYCLLGNIWYDCDKQEYHNFAQSKWSLSLLR